MVTSCHLIAAAQSSSLLMGARSQSLGHASACLEDEWSIFNNVAGLGRLKNSAACISYDVQPGFSAFSKGALAVSFHQKIGIGIGIYTFGDEVYQEQVASLGCGSSWGITAVGVKVNYIRYNLPSLGHTGVLTISMGGVTAITPRITVGAHITNINQPFLSRKDRERTPTTLTAGLLFKLTDKILLVTELEKDIQFSAIWKSGLEYTINKKFVARTGVNLHPSSGFFGMGFKLRRFFADYSFQFTPGWGSRVQATINWYFKNGIP